jgi:inorganic pyrophosphatase
LPPFNATNSRQLNVIVETPKGSRVKYAYDNHTGLLLLSKVLPTGMVFPFNFGFVPNTLAADGDPLDVLVLNEEPLIAGCLLAVKPIAVIEATQTEKGRPVRNDRVIGQAISKELPLEWQKLSLDQALAAQIELFFKTYNGLYGKKFKMLGIGGPQKAAQIIDRAVKLHESRAA